MFHRLSNVPCGGGGVCSASAVLRQLLTVCFCCTFGTLVAILLSSLVSSMAILSLIVSERSDVGLPYLAATM